MKRHLLKDSECRAASNGELQDGAGLILRTQNPNSKNWVYRYQLDGKRTNIGLGSYPAVSLKLARELHRKEETLVAQKIHPLTERSERVRRSATLKEVVDEYFQTKRDVLKTGEQWLSPFQHVFPTLGDMPVTDISVADVISTFEPIWKTKYPTASRALNRLDQVIKYAAGQGDWDIDMHLAAKAKARLGSVKHVAVHHKALPWQEMPMLWASLGDSVTHRALGFYLLTVVRVSNVTRAEWSEIDAPNRVWHIPAKRMKTSRAFSVPLTRPAISLIGQSTSGLIFPSSSAHVRGVVSENTWNKFFRANNWDTTAHGIRSTFRDWCADNKICDSETAEMCIQHETVKGNKVARAYYRSDLLETRREVMERWSEFLTTEDREAAMARVKAARFHESLSMPVEAATNGVSRTVEEVARWARPDILDDR